jgi:hypothetical protein
MDEIRGAIDGIDDPRRCIREFNALSRSSRFLTNESTQKPGYSHF